MRIEKISIKNYKVFQNVVIEDIGKMAVFLGKNGSGKTTLFDIFGFLKKCLNENVTSALQSRGGFSEVRSRGQAGDIEFAFQFRTSLKNEKEKLYTYILKIGEDYKTGKPAVSREILRYKRGSGKGAPWHFVDFRYGKGEAITNEFETIKEIKEAKREKYELTAPDRLAIKSLGQLTRFPAADSFRKLIEDWYISDFQINASRQIHDVSYNEQVSTSGDNLANVAKYMHDNHSQMFKDLLKKMRDRIPGVSNVEAKETDDGRIVLRFSDGQFKDPFIARFVSDGTIKMFAYLLILADPKPHSLLCIEEPENQLYPHLLQILAEEFRLYSSERNQVFISTHSPDFVNALETEELYYIKKKNGFSEINKISQNELLVNLIKEGDKLGSLWSQGLFEQGDIV